MPEIIRLVMSNRLSCNNESHDFGRCNGSRGTEYGLKQARVLISMHPIILNYIRE